MKHLLVIVIAVQSIVVITAQDCSHIHGSLYDIETGKCICQYYESIVDNKCECNPGLIDMGYCFSRENCDFNRVSINNYVTEFLKLVAKGTNNLVNVFENSYKNLIIQKYGDYSPSFVQLLNNYRDFMIRFKECGAVFIEESNSCTDDHLYYMAFYRYYGAIVSYGCNTCSQYSELKNGTCTCYDGFEPDLNFAANRKCVCPQFKHIENGHCVCNDGFVEKNSTCICPRPKYIRDGICLMVNACPPNHHIVDGRCTCNDGFLINPNTTQCECPERHQIINGTCSLIAKDIFCRCPENETMNLLTILCECDYGYERHFNGTCVRRF